MSDSAPNTSLAVDPDIAWGVSQQDSSQNEIPHISNSNNEIEDHQQQEGDVEEEYVDIAIIGGGLAGLAAAIGLDRSAIKKSIKVYERAPALRSTSQGMLVVYPMGMNALQKIDENIPELVIKAGQEAKCTEFRIYKPDGSVSELKPPFPFLNPGGFPPVLIQWHALQQVLASQLPEGIVCTGQSLHHFVEDSDSVILYFDGYDNNGSKRKVVRCQAVLGCDGVFSTVRRQMYPDDKPIYFGHLNWNAIVPTSTLPEGIHPPNCVKIVTNKNDESKWLVYLNDCGGGNTFWQLRVEDPEKALALSGSGGRGGLGLPGTKERLLQLVKTDNDVVSAIRGTPEKQIFERCIIARAVVSGPWCSELGRVALIGDAVHGMHPSPGLGGNSAFESVSILVQELSREQKQCEENGEGEGHGWIMKGLNAYNAKRRPKAVLAQMHANYTGATTFSKDGQSKPYDSTQLMRWLTVSPADADVHVDGSVSMEAFSFLQSIDPCSLPGVSMI